METQSNLARRTFAKLRKDYRGRVIAPHDLRLELKIQNTESLYDFMLLEDQSTKLATEVRLNKNDVMFVTSMGLFLSRVVTGQDAAAILNTYPNETEFAVNAGFTPAHLEAFYASTVRLQVKTREYVPGMHTQRFRYVPQTQKSSATNKSQMDTESGFVELPTHYRLSGRDEIKLQLLLKKFTGMQVENTVASTDNRLVIILRGFIIKDGAEIKKAAPAVKA